MLPVLARVTVPPAACAVAPDLLADPIEPAEIAALERIAAGDPRRAFGQPRGDPGLVAWAGDRGYYLHGRALRSAGRSDGAPRDEPPPFVSRRAPLAWGAFAPDGEGVAFAAPASVTIHARPGRSRRDRARRGRSAGGVLCRPRRRPSCPPTGAAPPASAPPGGPPADPARAPLARRLAGERAEPPRHRGPRRRPRARPLPRDRRRHAPDRRRRRDRRRHPPLDPDTLARRTRLRRLRARGRRRPRGRGPGPDGQPRRVHAGRRGPRRALPTPCPPISSVATSACA